MADYRLYFRDTDRSLHAVILACDDDDDAIRAVADHGEGRAKELWQGSRLVRSFDPPSET